MENAWQKQGCCARLTCQSIHVSSPLARFLTARAETHQKGLLSLLHAHTWHTKQIHYGKRHTEQITMGDAKGPQTPSRGPGRTDIARVAVAVVQAAVRPRVHARPEPAERSRVRSGPPRGGQAPPAFPIVNQVCVGILYGRAGRLTAKNSGFRPGHWRAPRWPRASLARPALVAAGLAWG